jgi:hypothetical protein
MRKSRKGGYVGAVGQIAWKCGLTARGSGVKKTRKP